MLEAQKAIIGLDLYGNLELGITEIEVPEPVELPKPFKSPVKLHPSNGGPYKKWMWKRLNEGSDDNLVYMTHYNLNRHRSMVDKGYNE